MKKEFFSNKVLVISLLLSIAVAATEVSVWMSLFVFVFISWKYIHEKFSVPKISKKLTPVIGALVFLIVYLQYKTIFGQEESTTVLLGLVSLSILNFETERDTLLIVLLGFMLVAIKSLFSLDFIWTIPAIVAFFGFWYSLLNNSKVNKAKYLIKATLRALPMTALLFIFFPRLVVFQSETVAKKGMSSGFSEELNPGRISELVLLNQTVFRAEFKNYELPPEQLYWRGTVLDHSEGFTWSKSTNDKIEKNQYATQGPEGQGLINYKVILEPMDFKNVFLLEVPIKISNSSVPIRQFQYGSFSLVDIQSKQIQFEVQSALDRSTLQNRNVSITVNDDSTDLKKYLEFPDLPPLTLKLVDGIKLKNVTLEARTEALIKYFVESGFVYTLKPEVYKNNIDDFLFKRKKGFCEHFAAAFGTVSRALGVPTRIVIGYQGGAYNSIGNFWTVSQKDAHAWVEVGIQGRWVRIDPTGLVSPLRLALGGINYFSLSEEDQMLYSKNKGFKEQNSFDGYLSSAGTFFENLNYRWTLLLLNYDLQVQLSFLKNIQGRWFVGIFFMTLLGLFLVFNRQRRDKSFVKRHILYGLIIQVESWAKRKGLHFSNQQTPLQILRLISEKYPELQSLLSEISFNYELIVYKEKMGTENYNDLIKRWKNQSGRIS